MSTSATTIVIADDDLLVREAYRALLVERGYNVLLAEDGSRVVKLVESTAVDVVLLDILMPRKEGLETLIELKQRFPRLTVFAMSGGGAHSRADFLTIAKKFGANAILRKPFPVQSLIDLLENNNGSMQRAQT